MPVLERFSVQAYSLNQDGSLSASDVVRLHSPEAAEAYARDLAERKDGVIAYEWRGDLGTGEEGKLKPLHHQGVLPEWVMLAFDLDHVDASRRGTDQA